MLIELCSNSVYSRTCSAMHGSYSYRNCIASAVNIRPIRPNKVKVMFLVHLPGQFFLSEFSVHFQVCYHFYQ